MVSECSREEQELQKMQNGSAQLVEGRRTQQQKIILHAVICLLKSWLWCNLWHVCASHL